MARLSRGAIPFVALGTAFIGIGATGQRVFLYVGVIFLALGVAIILKRGGGRG